MFNRGIQFVCVRTVILKGWDQILGSTTYISAWAAVVPLRRQYLYTLVTQLSNMESSHSEVRGADS